MQSQKLYEKERLEETNKDWRKASEFPTTIIGRKRLRAMRKALWELGIKVHIPMNSAAYTNSYCLQHGEEEPSDDFVNRLFSERHR